MEYKKPELLFIGQAETLVLGSSGPQNDPAAPELHSGSSALEFED
jgi:hypothetical protein